MVYLVRMAGTNFYKIGYTKDDPRRRINEIQVGNPSGLMVEAFWDGEIGDEQALHRYLHRHRRHGEWFELSVPILIEMIIDSNLGGLERKDARITFATPQEGIVYFLEQNFIMAKEAPKKQGLGLDDLFEGYCQFCKEHFIQPAKIDFLANYMDICGIGSTNYLGSKSFNMRYLDGSKFRHNSRRTKFAEDFKK